MSAFFSTTKVRPLFIRLPFIVWVFGVTLTLLTSPTHAQTQPSFMDNFRKVMDRPGDLTRPLQQARLAKDLPSALESLPAMLRNSGIEVIPKTPGTEVRLGELGIVNGAQRVYTGVNALRRWLERGEKRQAAAMCG